MQSATTTTPAPFRYPFRIFFLSTAVSALLLIPLWLFFLLGGSALQPALPALHWHQHEMLGAFVNSAIAGFLLTAVCAWTGARPVAGWPLAALWLLWLAGRCAMLFGSYPWLAMAVDLAFLPAVALLAARPIVARRQWRQLPLLAVLTLLWLCDLSYHLSGDTQWLRAAMLLTGGLILVVGGRITPAFSRNWLLQQGQPTADISTWRWLEIVTLASTLLLVLTEASGQLPPTLVALIALVAGLSAALRTLLWRGWRVRSEPLLAILHIGLLWVAAGFLLRSLAGFGLVPDAVWLHALGAGAMGTMILGVMARVALGHTGRPLALPSGITGAFGLIFLAGLLRVIAGLGWLPWAFGIHAASLCWTVAFALFIWRYFPILTRPRIDGKPG